MFLLLPRVEVVEVLAESGFDIVILDLEHGPYGATEILPIVAAAQGAGLHAVVRLAHDDPAEIGRVLDCGPDGILIPHVTSAESAARIVSSARFPPEGERSVNPFVRGLRYVGDAEALRVADERTAVICMIEGIEGVAAARDIAATDGVDALFVGPVDLSAALGVGRPDPEHPVVIAKIQELLAETAVAGVAMGIYAPSAEAAVRWSGMGARLIAVSVDIGVFRRAAGELRARIATGEGAEQARTGGSGRRLHQPLP